MPERPFSVIDVGFTTTGTTSLQLNFCRIATIDILHLETQRAYLGL
jgi:hypothetical protein